jgi:hypothetical protein
MGKDEHRDAENTPPNKKRDAMGFFRDGVDAAQNGNAKGRERPKGPMGFDPERYAEIMRRMKADAEERDRIARRLLESVFGSE